MKRGTRTAMSGEDRKRRGWRRWREIVLAACAVWLVIQNVVILTLVLWANPASALAAGAPPPPPPVALGSQLALLAPAGRLAAPLTARGGEGPPPPARPPAGRV